MISALSLGGTSLLSTKIFLTAFKNADFPAVVYSKAKRGGYQGNKLVTPTFASFNFALDFIIIGSNFSDLAQQRDAFFATLGTIHSAGVQKLLAMRTDNSLRYLDVKAVQVTGDITADDGLQSKLEVIFEGEYPYLRNYIPTFQNIPINFGGGMTVPMGVPLDLSHGQSTNVTITNNGNYPAYPTLTFTGQLTDPTVTITQNGISQAISFSNTLANSSAQMVVDHYNRTVILEPSGNAARQYMSGTFWQIPIGISTISLTTTNGGDTGNCQLSFNESFLNL